MAGYIQINLLLVEFNIFLCKLFFKYLLITFAMLDIIKV